MSKEQTEFEKELQGTINKCSAENPSNTPDWILAQYMDACLRAFNIAIQQRESWYGRDPRPTCTLRGDEIDVKEKTSKDHSSSSL